MPTNDIPTRQNESRQLERLAASRYLYLRAKFWLGLSLVLAVPIAAGLAVLVMKVAGAKPYAAIWSIFVTFINFFVFERWQKENMSLAASVQEKMDCDLFGIDWRSTRPEPTPEDVVDASERFKKRSLEPLKDWYPPALGEVPLSVARVICQRANCTWEKRVRDRYANALLIMCGALAVVVAFLGCAALKTFDDVILVLVTPLVPALFMTLRLGAEHREAARSSERLARHADALFKEVISGTADERRLAGRSRDLQDEIFERRRMAPPVFDWVYTLLRSSNETQMNRAAAELVEQAKAALRTGT